MIKSLLTEKGKLRINVIDSGKGIEPENFSELFKPFSRLGMENSTIPGMGLGLAKAKMLTEAIKGGLGFDNNSNGGVTFWLDIDYKN